MNRIVYNASMLIGTALITAGAWLRHGLPSALIVAGLLIICITIVGTLVSGREGG